MYHSFSFLFNNKYYLDVADYETFGFFWILLFFTEKEDLPHEVGMIDSTLGRVNYTVTQPPRRVIMFIWAVVSHG